MDKRIDFKGVSLSPSDYECADDELAYAFNVDSSNGSYAVSSKYGELFSVSSDYTLRAVHHTETQDNYIFSYDDNGTTKLKYGTLSGNAFSFAQSSGADITFALDGDLRQVVPVGNTLVVSTSEGIYYMLWEESDYTWLGGELPEVKVKPYLVTEQLCGNDFSLQYEVDNTILQDIKLPESIITEISAATRSRAAKSIELSQDVQTEMYDFVFGTISQCREKLRDAGRFDAPFFIRFAWRLYDGSYIHHTSPLLMVNGLNAKPYLYFCKYDYKSGTTGLTTAKAQLSMYMLAADLYFSVTQQVGNKWKDIIRGLDVFISEPFVTFTDSPKSIKRAKSITADSLSDMGTDFACQQYISPCNWARNSAYSLNQYFNKHRDGRNNQYDFKQVYMDIPAGYSHGVQLTGSIAQNNGVFVCYIVWKKSANITAPTISISSPRNYIVDDVTGYSDDSSHDDEQSYAKVTTDFPYKLDFYEVKRCRIILLQGDGDIVPATTQLNVANLSGNPDYSFTFVTKATPSFTGEIDIVREDNKSYTELAEESATFYRIKQYDLKELPSDSTPTKIDLSDGILNSLTTQPTLEDTGQCRTKFTSNYIYPYNNRINTVIESQTAPYIDCPEYLQMGGYTDETHVTPGAYDQARIIGVVSIKDGQKNLSYTTPDTSVYAQRFRLENQKFFYYPDPAAKELIIVRKDDGLYRISSVQLKRHEYLSGSYAIKVENNGSLSQLATIETLHLSITTDEQALDELKSRYATSYQRGNIIYTSDVNNPFRFDESNANAIQNSKILALATNTQALSEGQFGAHPLYAFTEDGVWALSVASDGAYSSVQPVSRDVLINKDSICSSDDSVFFGTERGIMQMSGSQLACITDILDGEFFNLGNTTFTSGGNTTSFIAALKAYVKNGSNVSYMNTPDDIKAFLGSCRMAYDYVGQRLVFYLPYDSTQGSVNPCMLVFNLRSKQWSMEENAGWLSAVNDYPDFCLNTAGASNKILSTSATRVPHDTMFVMTRPMKLDAPDVLKTVRQVLVRGILKRNDVQTMLYASRNLLDWVCIGTSTTAVIEKYSGTPYKYFSVGCYVPANVATSISKIKLSGLEIRFIPRDTNKLR